MQGQRFLLLLLVVVAAVSLDSKISPRVAHLLGQSTRNARGDVNLWVYFSDKDMQVGYEEVRGRLHPHSIARRRKVVPGDGVDHHDYPVNSNYISQVLDSGVVMRRASNWLNAISITVPSSLSLSQVTQTLSSLPFVSKIDVMASYTQKSVPNSEETEKSNRWEANESIDYGNSFNQLQMINVLNAHARGYNGTGITILILDSGFEKTHPAIAPLRIVAEYDFIENDNETQSFPPDIQNYHGTATLSCVGGWAPGNMIGSAFGASFMLAKTEIVLNESRTEEDNFIAAIEWGESLGADLVTASLGYTAWYTFYDIDGTVSPVSIACDVASKKGLPIVVSAGNLGTQGIATPADAFEVITVGAVQGSGTVSTFSSLGPAADGRIKPDVVGRGTNVWIANAKDVSTAIDKTNWFAQGSGTSFSCPLVAGVVAILLQAHPNWTPRMIKEALQMTASQNSDPDIALGWGIVDAVLAVNYAPKNGSCETNGCSQRGCCVAGQCQCNHPFFGPSCSFYKQICYSFCGARTSGMGQCLRLPNSQRAYRCAAPGGNTTDTSPTPQCDGCPLDACENPTQEPTNIPTIEPPFDDPTNPPIITPVSTTSNSSSSHLSPSLVLLGVLFLLSLLHRREYEKRTLQIS